MLAGYFLRQIRILSRMDHHHRRQGVIVVVEWNLAQTVVDTSLSIINEIIILPIDATAHCVMH